MPIVDGAGEFYDREIGDKSMPSCNDYVPLGSGQFTGSVPSESNSPLFIWSAGCYEYESLAGTTFGIHINCNCVLRSGC